MAHAFDEEIVFAVAALRRGEIVAYPTETFYGLGVDALDELALARLRALKGRDDKAISVLVDGPAMLDSLCASCRRSRAALMRRYWPGALTIALPARRGLPSALVDDGLRRRAPVVASRPRRRWWRGLGRPLTTTSANRAGRAARDDATRRSRRSSRDAAASLHGGATPGGAPSTLVRVRGIEAGDSAARRDRN